MNPIALIEVQAVTRRTVDGAVEAHPAQPRATRPSGAGRLSRLSAWLERPFGAGSPAARTARALPRTPRRAARGRA